MLSFKALFGTLVGLNQVHLRRRLYSKREQPANPEI